MATSDAERGMEAMYRFSTLIYILVTGSILRREIESNPCACEECAQDKQALFISVLDLEIVYRIRLGQPMGEVTELINSRLREMGLSHVQCLAFDTVAEANNFTAHFQQNSDVGNN